MDEPASAGRRGLLADRADTIDRIASLVRDLGRVVDATAGANSDDEHDPEGATIAFERAQLTALLDQARRRARDIDLALQRLDDGNYGVCLGCGEPVAPARLSALPFAATCIRCASAGRR